MDENTCTEITRPEGDQSLGRTSYWALPKKVPRNRGNDLLHVCFNAQGVVPSPQVHGQYEPKLPTRDRKVIPTEPARRKVGFSGVGFATRSEDVIATMDKFRRWR